MFAVSCGNLRLDWLNALPSTKKRPRTQGEQAGFDVAEAFAPGELGEGQDQKMFVSRQFSGTEIAVVAGDTTLRRVVKAVEAETGWTIPRG